MLYKKLFCVLLSISFVTLLFSQEEKPVVSPDSTEGYEIIEDDSYSKVDVNSVTKSKDNFLTKLFVTEVPFKEYDQFEVFYKNSVTKIKKGDAVFAVFKDEDIAGFGVQLTGCYYYTFFDRATRNKLITAGEQYLKDFEEKKLVRKSNKTFRAYGKSSARVRFGSLKGKAFNTCKPFVYFGYDFVDKSPYFHISVMGAQNERYDESPAYPKESYAYNIYLTKAQLATLMHLLSDGNVNQYVDAPVEKSTAKKKASKPTGDEY